MSHGPMGTIEAAIGDRYRVRQELGGGGMSATYIVDEIALGRPVVLKLLPPAIATGLNTERFEREIQIAARLQHAFLVPLLSAGIANGTPWYTMPLVQGESLRARLSREGAMPATSVARILRDVAEALAYAHGEGVIHRDIKPDNVLLSGAHALVTDFGVAKAVAASQTNGGAVTRTGIVLGTLAYIAPEQAAGDPNADSRADLYSLGAMGYEMLSGRPMFGERSPLQLLAAHASETPVSLASVAPAAPAELVRLIEHLIEKHPDDRPSRAQDVADALSAMLGRWTSSEGQPSHARLTAGRAFALWGAGFFGVAAAAWLAVRWLPVPPWTLTAAVLVMAAGLPVLALSAWLHRPARALEPLPSVSSTTTLGTIAAMARPYLDVRRALRLGVVGLGVVILLAATWAASRALGVGPAATLRSRGVVGDSVRVLVSDFVPPASDTSLGAVVGDLLRTEISRSRTISLVSAASRAAMLKAMGRPAGTPLTGEIASEVALRANAAVRIDGAISQLGSEYLLRATIVETSTGRELAALRETAASTDAIIGAVDRLGRSIRDELGASLHDIRTSPSLYYALTPYFEAVRLYTAGTRAAEKGDNATAIAKILAAVAVDTEFAEGYRRLASFYSNGGNLGRAVWAAEQAYRYRGRLPAPYQHLVEGTYYSLPTRDHDMSKSVNAYQAVLDVYPRSTSVLNNLGLVYLGVRDGTKALDAFQRYIQIDSMSAFAPQTILPAFWAAGRKKEGREYLRSRLLRWQPNAPPTGSAIGRMLASEFLYDSASRVLDSAYAAAPRAVGLSLRQNPRMTLVRVALTQGRLRKAFATMNAKDDAPDTVAGVSGDDLRRVAILIGPLERPREGIALLDSIARAHPPNHASALDYRWLDFATLYARGGEPRRAAEMIAGFDGTATRGARRYFTREEGQAKGWLAIAEHRYGDAVVAFRSADVGSCIICALPGLAHAYDLAGQPDSAIAVFERYLTTDHFDRVNVDAEYLAGTYKRLGELYAERGDPAKARIYFERFVDLWKHADPELQPRVAEVRKRLAQLPARDR